jgi:tripartite-type tricarboxylate transporter receptor subunit TctC
MEEAMRIIKGVIAACTAILVAGGAQAQDAGQPATDYPTKPITLIIPAGPGGSHDLTARAFTSVASQYLGQPMIVELKPGGGGAIGSALVAGAEPDGYTLELGGNNWNTTLPAVEGRSDGPDDLQAVCRVSYSPVVVATTPNAPYKTFQEMIAWAKEHPGELIFGTTGPWGQADLTWKQIAQSTGIETRVVPYDGGGPSTVALLGGHTHVATNPVPTFLAHIQSGDVVPLAVLDDKRHPELPDVPTGKEVGVDVVYQSWRAVLAPNGTPQPIMDKLAAACEQMVADKSVVAMIGKLGDEVQHMGPAEFEAFWHAEFDAHKALGESLKGQ